MIISHEDFPVLLTATTPFKIPSTVYFLLHFIILLYYTLLYLFYINSLHADPPTFLFSFHKHYLDDLIHSNRFKCHQYITDFLSS